MAKKSEELAQKLLDAHVEFEMRNLKGERLAETIREDLSAFYDWLGSVKVNDVLNREVTLAFLQREVMETPLPSAWINFILKGIDRIHLDLKDNDEPLNSHISRDVYDRMVAYSAQPEELRHEVIRHLTRSPLSGRLLSDIIYLGIQEFLTKADVLTKSIPGASTLLSFGQSLVKGALPGLEQNSEKMIKDFLANNIKSLLGPTEEILIKGVNEEFMREAADEFWNEFFNRPTGELSAYLDSFKEEDAAFIIEGFWEDYRKSPLCKKMVESLVDHFAEFYGERDIQSLLAETGWSKEKTLEQGTLIATPLMERVMEGGYAEAFLRRRLEAFYLTGPARDIL